MTRIQSCWVITLLLTSVAWAGETKKNDNPGVQLPGGSTPQLSKRCQEGDRAACENLRAFSMGYSNYAQQQLDTSRAQFARLCQSGKQEACKALKDFGSAPKRLSTKRR
ncbi:MAG: hypothetical protein A2X94_04030 [Bdellovibrionales bacterium GWB1_55_8]|nr:MAG: hypothetical protein A2X94_04030 [Bdellovibrionales bacterium GWB1_55_8]